jgi:two-component system, NtrC family, nitrogen regulation sensor histidine kinase NtrY
LEAIPAGGVVIIRTARFGGSAWIEVIDNGDGIPDALKSRIFIPNFSTKSAGTGLGLAICRKVVKAHKGDIAFSSTPGMGTTFTIRLPLCDMT